MKPGDLVKFSEKFFKEFGEVPLVGHGEYRRESRGIIIESESNRNDGKLRGLKPNWYILWDCGTATFNETWLEGVEDV